MRGEFHRIADEIEQHLPQPCRIADDPRRDIRANETCDVETPRMRTRREDFDRPFDQQGEIERRFGQRNLAGLKFRKVEDFIDEAGEAFAGVADRLDIGALLGSSVVAASRSASPRMPLSGVRISWLMVARSRDLASFAASARSRAISASFSA